MNEHLPATGALLQAFGMTLLAIPSMLIRRRGETPVAQPGINGKEIDAHEMRTEK